jgi:hypothetical protein
MNLADTLNLGCMCRTLQAGRLQAQLETDASLAGMASQLAVSHPHLFSNSAVFLDPAIHATLELAVATIERVIALPGYREHALAAAPEIAQHAFGPAGVFMGFDFHIAGDTPKLIEINTNAGGAFLNAALSHAHRECCAPMHPLFETAAESPSLGETFIAMFRAEWQAQRGTVPWRC